MGAPAGTTIQMGFWMQDGTDDDQPYIAAHMAEAGLTTGGPEDALNEILYYEYRLNRKYDFSRWRQSQGFQLNGKVNPSVHSMSDAKALINRSWTGHDGAGGNPQGTIIGLELTWGTKSPDNGITAASIIRGNFDFGPTGLTGNGRVILGTPQSSNGGGNGTSGGTKATDRWAARPQKFTAPTQGVSYGARSYDRTLGVPTDFPTDNSWMTNFRRDSVRSYHDASHTSYDITPGTAGGTTELEQGTTGLEAGVDHCYSLWETGLDILYLTWLYPGAQFIVEFVLEVNLRHGMDQGDIPKGSEKQGSTTIPARDSVLYRANYSDAILHCIAFWEAMGIHNVYYSVTIGGIDRYDNVSGTNGPYPWFGNLLAQEIGTSDIGAVESGEVSLYGYATGRTWFHLCNHDIYCGIDNSPTFRDPYEMNHSTTNNPSASQGVSSFCRRHDKYFTLWTTGVTYNVNPSPAGNQSTAKWPKNGDTKSTLSAGTAGDNDSSRIDGGDGTPGSKTNYFSAFKLVGDLEMERSDPRYWGLLYQMSYETQTDTNDYLPESDSYQTHSPQLSRNVLTGTEASIYGTVSGVYDRTHIPDAGTGRNGWRGYYDLAKGSKWYNGGPIFLPTGVPTNPTPDIGNWGMSL